MVTKADPMSIEAEGTSVHQPAQTNQDDNSEDGLDSDDDLDDVANLDEDALTKRYVWSATD